MYVYSGGSGGARWNSLSRGQRVLGSHRAGASGYGAGRGERRFSAFLLCSCVLGGSGKNDNAEKVTEKLEALSVKEESKESEDEETKEKAEEKQ